jgi:SAM-dependent methyltransferase
MRDLGWRVVGVEPSADAVRTARERLGLDVREGTLEQAALPAGSADVVTMRMVLEHVPDPRRVLAEAHRIMRPGGRILLSVPNAGSLEARAFGPRWFAWELPRHLSHFDPGSLGRMLRQAGFEGIRVRHLVNANNLAASLGYVFGRTGPASPALARLLLPVAALEALLRRSGRIAVEARRGAGP